ncbi:phage late control D family protein [Loktanella sp. 3ANDIMAR09]|uniref:phage late control D family protein n=1 Tax=Loktanella sp. 3ANDIMAR09 TaxID=1225657 RepID=UPI001C10C70A|nr:hypothetical protein [Loktanella sp. 3ANDIMAR09]
MNYVDHLHGKADEIDVTVQDKDGRWKGQWRPQHGDTMNLTIFDGYGGVLPCGTFEMDEPNATGGRGGDLMTIRGLAAPITKALRTEKSVAYERQRLRDVVETVAALLGMTVQGDIADLFFQRITQRKERYLAFIKRLAEETGHYCNIRGAVIVFTTFASIDGRTPSRTLSHGDGSLIDYDMRFQSDGTYSEGRASYLDQRLARTNEHVERDPRAPTGDTLRISGERLESVAHARARIQSEMHFANRTAFQGSMKTVGSATLVAGNTVSLTGFGGYSGTRVIDSSVHTIGRGGYTTTAELVDARIN